MHEWKDSMSGKNEDFALNFLIQVLGFERDKDFVRQHPIGERFVIDFAFVNEQVAIEIDGPSHNSQRQRKLDDMRDTYLARNGWVTIRIRDSDMRSSSKMRFYKNLIRAVVDERREQWQDGTLYPVDIPNFKQEDYE